MPRAQFVSKLAHDYLARGRPSGWFEPLYASAAGDAGKVPWADLVPNPSLVAWAERDATALRKGARALVVGCGLGDDAEELARRGVRVVAFDISPTAIDWAKRRFAGSPVSYEVADVFAPPPAYRNAFVLVFEGYTLQSFPQAMRGEAMDRISECVGPGGTLLVVALGRDEREEVSGPPWALAASELERLEPTGLELVRFEDFMDEETPPKRRFRAEYRRPRSAAS